MKKVFLAMLISLLAVVSCLKRDLNGELGSGDQVQVAISAKLDGGSSSTRALDNYGTGDEITRCIMEVYYRGTDGTLDPILYGRYYSPVVDKSADFSLKLVNSQIYNFLFWADCGDENDLEKDIYYNTQSLKEVTADYTEYNTQGDKRDAFFGSEQDVEVSGGSVSFDVTLKRPFGQLNVFSGMTNVLEGSISDITPVAVQYTYTSNIYNVLNVESGVTSGTSELVWNEPQEIIDPLTSTGYTHLSTDYIFAPLNINGDNQKLVDFSIDFYNAANGYIMTNRKFVNIPMQRNYRTNIYGELMTVGGYITVELIPEFEDQNIEIYVTGLTSTQELNEVLAAYQGTGDIKLGLATAPDDEIIIPNTLIANSVSLTFSDGTEDDEVKITAEDNTYAGTVYIKNESAAAMALTVVTPNADVYVSGSFNSSNISSK